MQSWARPPAAQARPGLSVKSPCICVILGMISPPSRSELQQQKNIYPPRACVCGPRSWPGLGRLRGWCLGWREGAREECSRVQCGQLGQASWGRCGCCTVDSAQGPREATPGPAHSFAAHSPGVAQRYPLSLRGLGGVIVLVDGSLQNKKGPCSGHQVPSALPPAEDRAAPG